MEKTPLEHGKLEQLVRDQFARSGMEDIGPSTPAALFVTVSKWDTLLTPIELRALKVLIRQMTPMSIGGFE